MITADPDFCDHCGLPIGAWPHDEEVEGEQKHFCCYGCFVGWQTTHGGGDDATAAGFLIRLGIGAFLAMNIMLFSLLLYSGALDGVDAEIAPKIHFLLWFLATPVLVILGGPFFWETVVELRQLRFPPSLLIILGSGAAYLYSAIATLHGSDRVYFDTTTMVLVLFTLGRYLEANARARATRSLRPMLEAERIQVRMVEDGAEKLVPLENIAPGMVVRVMPGERIPVDGLVLEGVSQAEQAALTGEPLPVTVKPGSSVMAGSVNCDGRLLIEATKHGFGSDWVAICREVRQALARPTHAERLADTAARAFVPIVAFIAVAVFALGWHGEAMDAALMAALAVLVVACPCALGLAAPLATSLGIAALAEHGVLVRSAATLEALSGVHSIAFDKTGTLTAAHIDCLEIVTEDLKRNVALSFAAAVAVNSMHPLSKAICDMAAENGVSVTPAQSIDTKPGSGVRGTTGASTVWLGSQRWLKREGMSVSETLARKAQAAARDGHMVAFAAFEKQVRALFIFSNAPHPDAAPVIRTLERRGLKPLVLTGDGSPQTERFCGSIGAKRWLAELAPQMKRATVEQLSERSGPVAMVGDGVNDALALTSAAVGIAVGSGTALARETADIVLPANRIVLLPQLLSVARTVKRTIETNLLWAFSYNGLAIALAATGYLQPVFAAALMAGSSVFVVTNSLIRMDTNRSAATQNSDARFSQTTKC